MPARGTKAVQAYRGWVATMRRAARSLREMRSQKRRRDNGSCYLSKAFARACKQLGVKHIKIKPYAPQTNGKAERSFRPRLREWAYATAFEHSEQRRQALLPWLHRDNWHRPHASLTKKPPCSAPFARFVDSLL